MQRTVPYTASPLVGKKGDVLQVSVVIPKCSAFVDFMFQGQRLQLTDTTKPTGTGTEVMRISVSRGGVPSNGNMLASTTATSIFNHLGYGNGSANPFSHTLLRSGDSVVFTVRFLKKCSFCASIVGDQWQVSSAWMFLSHIAELGTCLTAKDKPPLWRLWEAKAVAHDMWILAGGCTNCDGFGRTKNLKHCRCDPAPGIDPLIGEHERMRRQYEHRDGGAIAFAERHALGFISQAVVRPGSADVDA